MMDKETSRPELEQTLMTRVTLLLSLRNKDDDRKWREFFELYQKFIYGHASRMGLKHHEAEDTVQEVLLALVKDIDNYEPRAKVGSFRFWLSTKVKWRAKDRIRKHLRMRIQEPASRNNMNDPIESFPAVEQEDILMDMEWQKQLYEGALKRLAQKVNPKHYQVFYLHHKEEWSLKRIANEFGISRTSAYVINHRLKNIIKKELGKLKLELD